MAPSYNHKVFVGLLIEAMERQGFSQRRLAKELGVSQQLVSKWMAGRSKPNPSVAVHLARLLGVGDLEVLRAVGYLPAEADRAPSPPPADDLDAVKRQVAEMARRIAELEEIVASTSRSREARDVRPSR